MAFFLHLLITIGYVLPIVLGYSIVYGKGKILHFGPLAVSLVNSYAMFLILMKTGSYFIAVPVSLIAAVITSILFAQLSLRLEQDAFGVMAIAMHLMTLAIVLNWTSLTRGALGIPRIPRLPPLENMTTYATVTGVTALLVLLFYLWLERRTLCLQLAALAEHEWHAKALGVNRSGVTTAAFIILGISHVIATFLSVPYLRLLHPSDYGFPVFIFYLTVVIAGKPGSIAGATVAAILLTILKEALRFVPLSAAILGPVRLMLFGAILFAAVWYRRDTLFPKERTV